MMTVTRAGDDAGSERRVVQTGAAYLWRRRRRQRHDAVVVAAADRGRPYRRYLRVALLRERFVAVGAQAMRHDAHGSVAAAACGPVVVRERALRE